MSDRAWKHARAAFVSFHLLAVVLSALPSPGKGLDRKAWADPTVQDEFARWADTLGMESSELQDHAFRIASVANDGRNAILEPFRPYLKWAGTTQSWKMFVAAHVYPTRLQVQERRGSGAWEPLFEEHDPDAVWLREAFATERMRASIFVWGWPSYSKRWQSGCAALARRRFAEDASVTGLRCRMWKARSPTPQQAREGIAPPGEWLYERIVERS